MRDQDGNPTMLLLHAAGLDRTSWDDVVVRIPGFARTVAIDLPPVAYGQDAVRELASHVAQRMAEMRLQRPHVVGHSMGASVALELACRVPVAAVTAFCPIGFHPRTSLCGAKMRVLMRMARVFRRRMLDSPWFHRVIMSGLSARASSLSASVVAADVQSIVSSDVVALTEFACRYAFAGAERLAGTPVNLVWADRDRVVPWCDARRAARVVPHARHTALVDCGHLVMRDDPDGTAAVVHACHSQLMRDLQRRAAR